MSKVLTELGLELGFPVCLRHLLSMFGNDDKQATVCNIFSVSHSTSPKKVLFMPILLIISLGQRGDLFKAIW